MSLRERRKRLRTLGVVFVFGVLFAFCQSPPQDTDAKQIVQRVMSEASVGVFTSWDEKQLSTLGDASAREVEQLIQGKDLSATEIKRVLLIIQCSFDAPLSIKVKADRRPKAASLLVEKLDKIPAAAALREELSGTRTALRHAEKRARGDDPSAEQ